MMESGEKMNRGEPANGGEEGRKELKWRLVAAEKMSIGITD